MKRYLVSKASGETYGGFCSPGEIIKIQPLDTIEWFDVDSENPAPADESASKKEEHLEPQGDIRPPTTIGNSTSGRTRWRYRGRHEPDTSL